MLLHIKMNEIYYQTKCKAMSTIELTKDLINDFGILNGAKYFSSRMFQNHLAFIPAEKYINFFKWYYSDWFVEI